MKKVLKLDKYYLMSSVTLILLVLNVYAVKALVIFGSPILFALALLLETILLGIFIYSFVRTLTTPGNIVWSLLVSIWGGLASNDYVRKLRQSKSPLFRWLRRRLKRGNPYGLPLTITLGIALFFFVNFLGVLITVTSKGSLARVDIRVLNLMPSIRTPLQTNFFRIATNLANTETAILLIVATAAILWRNKQRLLAGLVIFIAAGEEAVTYIFKLLVHRARPDLALRLIRENSYSFPSGHTVRATVLFGLLAYLIFKSFTSTKVRVLTISLFVLSVCLVAASRIYLGVHYPSDVWGSVLLGSSMLTLVIGLLEIMSRYRLAKLKKIVISNRKIVIIPITLLIFAIISLPFLVRVQLTLTTPSVITIDKIDESTVKQLPLYSETLTGSPMEPINFIYVGYEDQIISTFKNHGWYKADPSTLSNTLRALAVGFQGKQYLTAPVTPSYLNFKPENIAFEQSTATHSLKQRHHTRLWRTDYALPGGKPIWVATASFDEGVEFAGAAKLPTHHIDPNIDGERAYIIKSLGLRNNLINIVHPQLGKNASGDSFFTDGKAQVTVL